MRSLILGAGGLLGGALVAELEKRSLSVTALTHEQIDIAQRHAVREAVGRIRPDVVYNCAAFTRVDECEAREELAAEVNGKAVGHLADAVERNAALLVQVSTDYVFDGRSARPYGEDAAPRPLSAYGRTKLAGEREALRASRALVVRTSWLFGAAGPSFVTTVLRLLEKAEPLRVVDDQMGCPTYAPYLARALADLAGGGARGIVHYRNRYPVSWYGFAREIAALVGSRHEIVPVSTGELPRPARRPAYSVLAVERFEALAGRRAERWRPGLEECLASLARDRKDA